MIKSLLACSLAVGLLALGIQPASTVTPDGQSGPIGDPPAAHGRYLGTLSHTNQRDKHKTAVEQKARSAKESCTPTAPGSKERRTGAVSTCVSVKPASSRTTAAHRTGRAAKAGNMCAVAKPGYWRFERLSACLREMLVNYTYRDTKGKILGSAVFYVSTSAILNPRSGLWSEEILVEATQYKGQIKSTTVEVAVSCTSKCKATKKNPWVGSKTLTDGQVAGGSVSYSNVPAAGAEDATTVNYELKIAKSGTTPTPPHVTWSNPDPIRCDSHLTDGQNVSTGCAVPSVIPELTLPLKDFGAAAATYDWAQYHLPDKWGRYLGKPLTRALDGDERRKYTCDYKSSVPFVKRDGDDSCDEFPFASTWEGGTDGGKCAEIVPLFEGGQWNYYEADPNRPVTEKEPCVRGHVPLKVNSRAGTEYSNLIQSQRLVDKDPFYVQVPV